MDKVAAYEQAILSILNEYTQIKYSNVQGGNYLVADKQNHRYQVMTMGWQGHLFVHDCPIHMDIVNDKVWIFQNMTEWDLGTMLEERGVPKSDIVLGFFRKNARVYRLCCGLSVVSAVNLLSYALASAGKNDEPSRVSGVAHVILDSSFLPVEASCRRRRLRRVKA